MEVLIHPTTNEEYSETFEVSEPTTILADFIGVNEVCTLERLGPSGVYLPLTNKQGTVYLSALPNTFYIETNGTYRVHKFETERPATVGYVNASNISISFQYSLEFSDRLNSFYIPLVT